MNEKERVEAVSHCRYVDEVIPLAPWIITPEYMRKHKIDYVSHGEDLSVDENGNDVYQGIKDLGRFLVIKRTDGISTSDLILRIVKDYDKYVRRNLQRGYSYKEMNVGWAKRQEIKFDTQVEKLKKNYEEIKEDVIDSLVNNRLILDFKKWRDTSEEMLKDFVVKFKRGPKPISDRPRGLESPESPQDDDRYAHLFVGEEEEAEDLN
jgi:choline-phosphate cytidylyltransferase